MPSFLRNFFLRLNPVLCEVKGTGKMVRVNGINGIIAFCTNDEWFERGELIPKEREYLMG